MALKKPINTLYGVPATYWRIVELSIDYSRKIARMRIAGYIDEQARLDNKAPIEFRGYNCNPKEFDKYFSNDLLSDTGVNPLKQAYEFAKSNDLYDTEFHDAEDV